MKLTVFKIWILTAVISSGFYNAYAQQAPVNKLKIYTTALENLRQGKPIEKLYLQTDKPYYSVGDTLRFKGYLLNADFLTPAQSSGLLYIELDDDAGKSAKRIMVPLISGMAWGDMAIDSTEIPDGSYTLRAYTNWMRNFGEDYVFKKNITIASSAYNPLLVKSNFKQNGNKVEGELQFSLLDGRIQAFRDVELKVMNGRKNLSKDKLVTGPDGAVKFNISIPENAGSISIQARTADGGLLNIPVSINRRENIDVQFMPEGGQLVAGLPSKIGFKAIGEDGKGVSVSGKILDSKGNQVSTFTSAHAGMGSFEFTATAGETYLAKVDGIVKTYALPATKPRGTSLAVTYAGKDSLRISLSSTADVKGTYYLIAQSRGLVCYAQMVSKLPQAMSIASGLFSTGIVRFSLISSDNQAVNERIVFVNHPDDMRISVEPQKATYGIRDSIALAIKVTDKDGKPVEGNFSIAVTDNSKVKPDSLGINLLTHMLFTSDIKGNIEEPGYYFNGDHDTDLDNLLLTQGWVGYSWQDVFHPKLPYAFNREMEFTISGKVTNAFGNAVENSNVLLLSTRPAIFNQTMTGKDGRFLFKDLFPVDTAIFKLQARNKRNKEFNLGITMDEIAPPLFAPSALSTPWYLNSDTTLLNNSKTKITEAKALSSYRGEGNVLMEAVIKAKKIIPESKNLNGPGEADQIIGEEELKKADKMTLLELIEEKIPGFNVGSFTPAKREFSDLLVDKPFLRQVISRLELHESMTTKFLAQGKHKPWRLGYKIYNQEVRFIIDGIDLDYFYDDSQENIGAGAELPPDPKKPDLIWGADIKPKNETDWGKPVRKYMPIFRTNDTERMRYIKPFLEHFTANDITGIELMTNRKYASKYDSEFEDKYLSSAVVFNASAVNNVAYLEITTRAKKGPFMQITSGTYLYRALPFSLAKQFYSPKYTVKNKSTAMGTDLRSTIFWEPNVVTDKEGKATISFYSADKASNYTVVLEGTDMGGQLGYKKQIITVSR
jgi:hypothetical protein